MAVAILFAVGALLGVAGCLALLLPERLLRLASRLTVTTRLRLLAAGIRIALGTLLLASASRTALPQLAGGVGALLLLLGVALLFVPNHLLARWVAWAIRRTPTQVRIGGAAGCAFGLFLAWLAL